MALTRFKGDLPADAVLLSESEALKYQWETIWDWKPQSEVILLRYGYGILGGLSTLSGFYINNYYRNKLRLGSYGRLSSYIPIVVLPGVLSAFFHQQFVTSDIILQKQKCPVCLETRATLLQSGFGLVYPAILGPIAGFMNATQYGTYNVPPITSKYKEVYALYRKMSKPISFTLVIILGIHMLAATVITYQENKINYEIHLKLQDFENKVLSNYPNM